MVASYNDILNVLQSSYDSTGGSSEIKVALNTGIAHSLFSGISFSTSQKDFIKDPNNRTALKSALELLEYNSPLDGFNIWKHAAVSASGVCRPKYVVQTGAMFNPTPQTVNYGGGNYTTLIPYHRAAALVTLYPLMSPTLKSAVQAHLNSDIADATLSQDDRDDAQKALLVI